MLYKSNYVRIITCIILVIVLCAGFAPPYNDFAYAETIDAEAVDDGKVKEYKIELDGMGVSVFPDTITVTVGGIYSQLPKLQKENHDFLGWFTGPYGGDEIREGDVVEEPVPKKLYARWKGAEVTITLDPCRGELSETEIKVNYGESYYALPNPYRSGLEFMGWYTAKSGGKLFNPYDGVSLTSDIKLYAKWAPVWYLQTDKKWRKKWYRVSRENSTIGSAGCGPTTMAMVVASLKSNNVTPVTACKWSRKKGYKAYMSGTKDGFFKSYGKKYGIKVSRKYYGDLRYTKKKKAKKYHTSAKNAVKNGNWVVVLAGRGKWTKGSGHFILWYKTEGGYAYIRDSNSTKSGRAKAKVSTLQKQAKRYWVISVPENKKVN